MPRIVDVVAEIAEVPLRHHFATARDQLARQVSRPVVIRLLMDDGSEAVGEAAAVAYVTGETPETVLRDVATAGPSLAGLEITRIQPIEQAITNALPQSPTARAGVEMAAYNAFSQYTGVPLWRLFGGARRSVETDVTLSIVPDAPERARAAWDEGIRVFKVKLGSPDRESDFARLMAVSDAVPDARFRLDANQAFTPDEALAFLHRVLDAGLQVELLEQPVAAADLVGLNRVAAGSPVPVFADEAVKSPADALRLVRESRVQGINVKLMKSGISGALDIIAIARAAALKLMLGCMLETRRGIACSLALACGTGAFDSIDLDSHILLREEGENPY